MRRPVAPLKAPPLTSLTLWSLLTLLCLTQWAFGGIHPWAYARTAAVLGVLVCTLSPFVLMKTYRPGPQPMRLHLPPLCMHAALFAFLTVLQTVSLPTGVVEIFSPLRPAFFVPPLSPPEVMPLSLAPHSGRVDMLKWVPMALAYLLGVYAIRTVRQAGAVFWTVLGLGLFQAAYGILQSFGGTEQVWNWAKTGQHGFVTGTYISRNELAFFLELAALMALGAAMGEQARSPRPSGWQGLLSEAFWRPILPGFMGVILAVTLLLTGSRGGILSCGVGLLCMALLFASKRTMRPACWKILGAALVIAVYGLGVGLEKTAERFGHDGDLIHRLDIAASVLPMIADFPLAGVGMGAFNTAYGPYALPQYGGDLDVVHAHNDWVEIAAEAGLPGLALCVSGFVLFMTRCVGAWKKRNDPLVLGICAGLMSGLTALALHSFFDFGMRVPANALAVGILCALLWNLLHMRTDNRGRHVFLSGREITHQLRPVLAVGAVAALTTAALFVGMARTHLAAENLCPTERTIFPEPLPLLDDIRHALRLQPDNPALVAAVAAKSMELFLQAKVLPAPSILLSEEYFRAALHKDPANGLTWRQYAQTLSLGLEYFLGGGAWELKAVQAYERALSLRPHDPRTALAAAHHHLWGYAMDLGGSRERGMQLLAKTLQINPWRWKQVLDLALEHVNDRSALLDILPHEERERAHEYLDKMLQRG